MADHLICVRRKEGFLARDTFSLSHSLSLCLSLSLWLFNECFMSLGVYLMLWWYVLVKWVREKEGESERETSFSVPLVKTGSSVLATWTTWITWSLEAGCFIGEVTIGLIGLIALTAVVLSFSFSFSFHSFLVSLLCLLTTCPLLYSYSVCRMRMTVSLDHSWIHFCF